MKKNHYCYIAKDFMDFFVEMMVEILNQFYNFYGKKCQHQQMMKKWNAIWKQFVTYVEGHLIEKINISLKLKIIVITKENRGPALLVSNLKYKEHRDAPV